MSERQYWLRLLFACALGGFLLFYGVLNLTVKGGKVTMPDIKGLGKGAAAARLSRLGLRMSVREERFSPKPYGSVLEVDIEAGATLKRGRTVEVILSKGSERALVPQLLGLASPRQARLLLEQNGLSVAVEDALHDASPKDTVLAQSPGPGVEAVRGATVSLLYSLGPEPPSWVMPDFVGKGLAACRAVAQKMGLVLRRVTEKEQAGMAPGMVVLQTLKAGTRVEEGMELNLTVTKGLASSEGARLVSISFVVPEEGVTERRVLITVTDAMGERVVKNSMARPGDTVSLDTRVHGKASYKVSLSGQLAEEMELP